MRILLVLLIAFLVGSANAAPPGPNELVVALQTTPGPFDPAVTQSKEQLIVIRRTYESLVRSEINTDGTTTFLPMLAKRWTESADGLTWTFELDLSKKFDDGTAITPDAVKFSLDRLIALARGPSSRLRDLIARIDTQGKSMVLIQLQKRSLFTLHALSEMSASIINPAILAHEIAGDKGSQWLGTRTAGTGPFRLDPSTIKGSWVLVPNKYFGPLKGSIEKIIFQEVKDPAVRSIALMKGDVDMAFGLAQQDLAQLEADANIRIYSGRVNGVQNLALNTAAGPLTNPLLRQAIAHSIDVDAVVKFIRNGRADKFIGPIPRGMLGATSSASQQQFDLALARRLFAESGTRPQTKIDLIYPGVSLATDTLAQFLQASLIDLGLQVRLQRLTIPAMIDRVGRGTYDAVLMGWVLESNDPSAVMNVWFDPGKIGSAGNYARYNNPAVTKLINESLVEPDVNKRISMLTAAATQANADTPYVYLLQGHNWVAARKAVQGYEFNAQDFMVVKADIMTKSQQP